jgi:Tfp pilus assembly protein PilF
MKPSRVLLYLLLIGVGVIAGYGASSYLSERGYEEAARANLYATGESLRKGDAVAAMNQAQAAVVNAPYAYDPYEAVGDVYVRLGLPFAAKRMYETALQRLATNGKRSMLVTNSFSPDSVITLLKRKLDALPPRETQPTGSP